MSGWLRWAVVPAALISAAAPAHAAPYLTVEQAQRLAFPVATSFAEAHVAFKPSDIEAIQRESGQQVRTRGEQVWKAQIGTRTVGFFIVDYVIGKHLVIDYAVALDPDGRVRRVDILEYRESYGGEVANRDWLAQFTGKTSRDGLQIDKDIRNISGATLSSRHVTEGVKRVLAIYDTCLR